MQGMLIGGALLAWTVASFAGAALFASFVPRRWGFSVAPLMLIALLSLPMIDEARAKPRFHALCQERATIRPGKDLQDSQPVREGRRAFVEHVNGPLVARETFSVYLFGDTDQRAFSYSTLAAQPGWFVQAVSRSSTAPPILFNGGCAPQDLAVFVKKHPLVAPSD